MTNPLKLLILFALLTELFLAPAVHPADADGVQIVAYPLNVSDAIPFNPGSGLDGGASYRANNVAEGPAPFVVVAKIVGYNGDNLWIWLTEALPDVTVQTYDRFDSGADKGTADTTLWLDENSASPGSRPVDLDPVTITAHTFYIMVIGRLPANPGGNPTFTVQFEIDFDDDPTFIEVTGSVTAATPSAYLAAPAWYTNWNDSAENGDPVADADYAEFFGPGLDLDSIATAPVDASGYFQVVMPAGIADSYNLEAMIESGSIQRHFSTEVEVAPAVGEVIYSEPGTPTLITLQSLTATSARNTWLPAALLLAALALSSAGLFIVRRKR